MRRAVLVGLAALSIGGVAQAPSAQADTLRCASAKRLIDWKYAFPWYKRARIAVAPCRRVNVHYVKVYTRNCKYEVWEDPHSYFPDRFSHVRRSCR
jgi:hypothetical protein